MSTQFNCEKRKIELNEEIEELNEKLNKIKSNYENDFVKIENKRAIERIKKEIEFKKQQIDSKVEEIDKLLNDEISKSNKSIIALADRIEPKIQELQDEINSAKEYQKMLKKEPAEEKYMSIKETTLKKLENELNQKNIELKGLQNFYSEEMQKLREEKDELNALKNNFENSQKDMKPQKEENEENNVDIEK